LYQESEDGTTPMQLMHGWTEQECARLPGMPGADSRMSHHSGDEKFTALTADLAHGQLGIAFDEDLETDKEDLDSDDEELIISLDLAEMQFSLVNVRRGLGSNGV
jgi:hypothetical protein